MAHGLQGYAKYWENWLQWAIIFGVFLCVVNQLILILGRDSLIFFFWPLDS